MSSKMSVLLLLLISWAYTFATIFGARKKKKVAA
jgi:hypothetical protein